MDEGNTWFVPLALVMGTLLVAGGGGYAAYRKVSDDHSHQVRRYAARRQTRLAQIAAARTTTANAHQVLIRGVADQAQQDIDAAISSAQNSEKNSLEQSILQDVQNRAKTNPLVTVPSNVSCISTSPITATTRTAMYSCVAVTSTSSNGTQNGSTFTATVDLNTGAYQWRPG